MAGYENSFPTFCIVVFSMATCFYFKLLTCQRSKAHRIQKAFYSFVSPVSSWSCCQMKKNNNNKVPLVSDLPLLSRFIIISSRCAGYFHAMPYHRPLTVKNPLPSCLSAADGSIGINSKPWFYYWGKWLFKRNNSFILGAKMKPFIPKIGIQMPVQVEVLTPLEMSVWPVCDWRSSEKGEERRVVGKPVFSFFRLLDI